MTKRTIDTKDVERLAVLYQTEQEFQKKIAATPATDVETIEALQKVAKELRRQHDELLAKL